MEFANDTVVRMAVHHNRNDKNPSRT